MQIIRICWMVEHYFQTGLVWWILNNVVCDDAVLYLWLWSQYAAMCSVYILEFFCICCIHANFETSFNCLEVPISNLPHFCFSFKAFSTLFSTVQIIAIIYLILHNLWVQVEYSRKEIRQLLQMIDVGNRPRWSQKSLSGLKRTVSAFGIVGMCCSFKPVKNCSCQQFYKLLLVMMLL